MPTVSAGSVFKFANEEIGQAAIVVEQNANLPGAGLAEIDRREGVDGDQRRWPSIGHAAREAGVDCVMVGGVNAAEPSRALFLAQAAVGRHRAPFAFGDD